MSRYESSRIPPTLSKTAETIPWDSWTDLLLWGQEELAALGPRESQTNAEYLLEEASGLKRWQIQLKAGMKPEASQAAMYRSLIDQRKRRMPAAYVTGKAFFREECLEVSSACLIPRPETELLVEAVIQKTAFERAKTFEFLDLGTGSGAISVSLLRFFSNATADMADISGDALALAGRNCEKYGLTGRYRLVLTDFFSAFKQAGRQKVWPVIVSNPPYLAAWDWAQVEPELLHEPRLALDGGTDGLWAYRVIAREAADYLEERGQLFLEVGAGQAESVQELLAAESFKDIEILKDLSGIDRIVTASSPLRP